MNLSELCSIWLEVEVDGEGTPSAFKRDIIARIDGSELQKILRNDKWEAYPQIGQNWRSVQWAIGDKSSTTKIAVLSWLNTYSFNRLHDELKKLEVSDEEGKRQEQEARDFEKQYGAEYRDPRVVARIRERKKIRRWINELEEWFVQEGLAIPDWRPLSEVTNPLYDAIEKRDKEILNLKMEVGKQRTLMELAKRGKRTAPEIRSRLFVEDIDSFRKVRDINPAAVKDRLKNGYLDEIEDNIQTGFESILGVSFHKKDWGGELNDLYTSNVTVAGRPVPTAFLLKGRGLGRHVLTISDCGKNGDQLVRLFDSPAELFVVQHVGEVDEMLIKDVEGKATAKRAAGSVAQFMIINGQDTARLLKAYGLLKHDPNQHPDDCELSEK